ncbi:MAG: hypothetical protein ACJ8AT_30700 [Hyalangium sp.]|uniref:hypothetical protein n=1 Tax=Hyalangium sp. TaxID=2028555 RepID=UPI003899B474
MSKPTWAGWWAARSHVCQIAQLLVLLLAPRALADRLTVNPDTQLSLDFQVPGMTPCILLPEKAYDPEACAGVPQEKKVPPASHGGSVRALVFLQQPGHVFIFTLVSIQRPGIGQMYDRHIQGFIQGTLKNLSQEFGAPMQAGGDAGKEYTLERENGVPVARWEYTTKLPDSDPRTNTANAVVYLIPSRDTLDILSVSTRRQDLEAARFVGEQVISTLQLPLTIDADTFGGDMTYAVWWAVGRVLVPLVLVLVAAGWIGWRYLKARGR